MTVLPMAPRRGVGGDEAPLGVQRREWVWALATAGCWPLVAGCVAVCGLLTVVTSVAVRAGASVRGVALAVGPGWLAANHIPLAVRGSPLGVLPLLPTALVSLLAASAAAGAARRLGLEKPVQVWPVVATVGGSHAVFGATLALASAGGPVTAPPALAFFGCGMLAAVSSLAGMGCRRPLVDVLGRWFGTTVVGGLRAGVLGVVLLLAAGTAMTALGLLMSFPMVGDVFARAGSDAGSEVGLALLSVGYLPNASVCGLSFLAGPGFSVGRFSASAFGTTGSVVPAFPLLPALPGPTSWWWPIVLLVPAAVGVFVGLVCRRAGKDSTARLRMVAMAAGVVAVCCVLLATLAGGELGDGVLTVSVPAGLLGALCFCWIAVPGALLVHFGASRAVIDARPAAPVAADSEPAEAAQGQPATGDAG